MTVTKHERAKYRVLIVDDDDDFVEQFVEFFALINWDATGTTEGAHAIELLDSTFDAVVLDSEMPRMSGFQVLEAIRRRPDLDRVFVVMLTAYGSSNGMIEAFRDGVDYYLFKPLDLRAVEKMLVFGITKKRAQLRVVRAFLCHSSADKMLVRQLYDRLKRDLVQPWMDVEDILPGRDWELEIKTAIRASDVVVVCLSGKATTKAGYLQREIKTALDMADEQPEGRIFIIPLKVEPCDVPERLRRWQWIDYSEESGYDRLIRALRERSREIGLL